MGEKELYEQALNTWGHESQIIMAIEECGELITALAQAYRGRNVDIAEEIADVKIMMEQLSLIFGETLVEEIKHEKLKRLAKRLHVE